MTPRIHKRVSARAWERPLCNYGRHNIPAGCLTFDWKAVTCLRCLVEGGIRQRPTSRYADGRSGIGSGRPLR